VISDSVATASLYKPITLYNFQNNVTAPKDFLDQSEIPEAEPSLDQ